MYSVELMSQVKHKLGSWLLLAINKLSCLVPWKAQPVFYMHAVLTQVYPPKPPLSLAEPSAKTETPALKPTETTPAELPLTQFKSHQTARVRSP
jgi:hypothetical protein